MRQHCKMRSPLQPRAFWWRASSSTTSRGRGPRRTVFVRCRRAGWTFTPVPRLVCAAVERVPHSAAALCMSANCAVHLRAPASRAGPPRRDERRGRQEQGGGGPSGCPEGPYTGPYIRRPTIRPEGKDGRVGQDARWSRLRARCRGSGRSGKAPAARRQGNLDVGRAEHPWSARGAARRAGCNANAEPTRRTGR